MKFIYVSYQCEEGQIKTRGWEMGMGKLIFRRYLEEKMENPPSPELSLLFYSWFSLQNLEKQNFLLPA